MAGGKRKGKLVHRPGQMYKKPRYTENPRERLEESERSSPANYSGATSSRAIEEDNTSFIVPRKQSKRGRNRAKKRWNPANRSNKSIPALSKEISASFTRIKASINSTLDRMAPPSHCKVEPIATQQLTGPCYPGQKNDVISHRDDVMPRPRDTLSTHSGGFGGAYSHYDQKYGHCDHRASTTITTLAPPLSWSKEIHTREVKREYDSELSFVPQHTRCPFTIQPSTDRTVVPSGNWSSTDRAVQSSTFGTAQQPSSSQCFTGDFPTQQSDPPGSCPLLPPTPVPRRNQTSHSPPVQIRNQTPHSAPVPRQNHSPPVPRQNQTYHSPPVPRQNQSFHSPLVPRRNQTYHSTPVPRQNQSFHSPPVPRQNQTYSTPVPRQNQSFHSPPVPRQNQTYHSTPVPRQNQSFDSPPVPRRNRNGREVVALDCEMVGCRPDDLSHALEFQRLGKRKKKPPKEVSVAGRCSIVDYHGNVLYDSYIRPNRPITSLRTFCSGITASHMHRATPIDHARLKIVEILREKVVVAHHIKNDLDALSISLPPELVRDTSSFPPLQRMAGLVPRSLPTALSKLSLGILGRQIQQGAHCSCVDARTTMELYRRVETEWEDMICAQ